MGPFIITAEKRKKELEKIESFLFHITGGLNVVFRKAVGDIRQYMSFDHFIHVNNIHSGSYEQMYPIGYCFGKTGIIYFPHINDTNIYPNAINRVVKIIAALNDFGVEDWILDFRSNSGGLFASFIGYICAFMPDEYTINNVSRLGLPMMESLSNSIFTEGYTDSRHITDMPYVPKISIKSIKVLVNRGSASSSEFCAHLLKTHSGAKIIGQKTAGAFNTPESRPIMLGNILYPGYTISGADITPDDDYEVLLE